MENFNNPGKQKKWEETLSQIEKVTDGLGKSIDLGVRESVAVLSLNGLITSGSCEGHLDRGRLYPWVQIEHQIENPKFKERAKFLFDQMKSKEYEEVKNIPKTDELYSQLMELSNVSATYKKEVENKIKTLLSLFYSSHKPLSEDYVLNIWEGGSFFELSLVSGAGVGKDNWKKFDFKKESMTPEEQKNYLKNSQNEMDAFTKFLKDIFFKK